MILCLWTENSFAVFDFVSKINCNDSGGNCVGTEDYSTTTLWEAATDNATDLTDGTVKCGQWDNQSGSNVADAVDMDWDGGASTGTLTHMTNHATGSEDHYMIVVTGGSLAASDVLLDVATSTDGFSTVNVDTCKVVAEVYNDDGDVDEAGTASYAGVTTDTTNFRTITAPVGERHDGTYPPNGATLTQTGNNVLIGVSEANFIFEWMFVYNNRNSSFDRANLNITGASAIVRNVMALAENSGSGDGEGIGVAGSANTTYCFNTVSIAKSDYAFHMSGGGGGVQNCENCTAINSPVGFLETNGTNNVKNSLAISNTTEFDTGINQTTNGCTDTSCTGQQNLGTDCITSITAGSENPHLTTGCAAIDNGTDLGITRGVNIDIDNEDRNADIGGALWDIGADEFVAAAVVLTGTIWKDIIMKDLISK